MSCTICFETDDTCGSPLIASPCQCKGTSGLLHQQCLQDMRRYPEYAERCSVCKSIWTDYILPLLRSVLQVIGQQDIAHVENLFIILMYQSLSHGSGSSSYKHVQSLALACFYVIMFRFVYFRAYHCRNVHSPTIHYALNLNILFDHLVLIAPLWPLTGVSWLQIDRGFHAYALMTLPIWFDVLARIRGWFLLRKAYFADKERTQRVLSVFRKPPHDPVLSNVLGATNYLVFKMFSTILRICNSLLIDRSMDATVQQIVHVFNQSAQWLLIRDGFPLYNLDAISPRTRRLRHVWPFERETPHWVFIGIFTLVYRLL